MYGVYDALQLHILSVLYVDYWTITYIECIA